ncbi:DUF2220 domain-containing protein [Nocardia sp. NBC_01329]|uniref:DUF2220 domain-containing protein n=1 Tax=Nocardia sp. NBC_01329 TaxID=2903594 RepID=UPI002E15F9A6|nr:DUF2220 domain-containing protein [Nocardia sp. NBC_01329]
MSCDSSATHQHRRRWATRHCFRSGRLTWRRAARPHEITYLAFPSVEDAVVIFGEGYAASRLQPLKWLDQKNLVYWGDIDTHGFAILNSVRRSFAGARSMLMDRTSPLAHESHWGAEPNPTREHLELLSPDEASLYTDLAEGVLGRSVRLEQERISYTAIEQATQRFR